MSGTSIGGTNSLTSQTGAADSSRQINKGPSSSRIFYEAVVLDFIANSADIDESTLSLYTTGERSVSNPSFVENMPRNSIIAQVISDSAGKKQPPAVFYPFFSSHLSLPVKAGETVWVLYPAGSPGQEGYWMTRSCGSSRVNDLNYTFKARESMKTDNQSPENNAEVAQEGSGANDYNPLGFPPGGGRNQAKNWMTSPSWPTETRDKSTSYGSQFTPEPVPSFSKRSPDLALQGSNNTLICLGEDRGRNSESSEEDTLVTDSTVNGKGTIDIVAGRSIYADGDQTIFDKEGAVASEPWNSTLPAAVASNEWEYKEVDKTPQATQNNSSGPNPLEGDPDFINDLSRVYVSMKTSGDSNFSLEYPNTASTEEVSQVEESPYIVLKSDEIRLIGRKNDDQSVNGSIRIVKEGTEDEDRAVIMMLSDGTIMVDGPKIVIGSGIESGHGLGNQVFIGRDATESIVLGDKLNSLLVSCLQSMLTAAPSFVATGVGPGVLNPDVVSAITTLITELNVTKSNLSKIGKTR